MSFPGDDEEYVWSARAKVIGDFVTRIGFPIIVVSFVAIVYVGWIPSPLSSMVSAMSTHSEVMLSHQKGNEVIHEELKQDNIEQNKVLKGLLKEICFNTAKDKDSERRCSNY